MNLPADSHDDVVLANLADSDQRPPKRGWGGLFFVVFMAVIVLGPVLLLGLPHEVGKWYEAAAVRAYEAGDTETAEKNLEQSLRWASENQKLYLRRAQWKLEAEDYQGAYEDASKAVEIAPDDTQALMTKSVACQHLDRHAEAIEIWKSLAKQYAAGFAGNRAQILNGLAYAQAVGNTELDEALQNVQKALELTGDGPEMLDTRGYIYYLRGEYEAAAKDLERAVDMMESRLRILKEDRQYVEQRERDEMLKLARHSTAVILYHRLLLNEALQNPEAAEKDRQRILELGFEPGEHLF